MYIKKSSLPISLSSFLVSDSYRDKLRVISAALFTVLSQLFPLFDCHHCKYIPGNEYKANISCYSLPCLLWTTVWTNEL